MIGIASDNELGCDTSDLHWAAFLSTRARLHGHGKLKCTRSTAFTPRRVSKSGSYDLAKDLMAPIRICAGILAHTGSDEYKTLIKYNQLFISLVTT